MEMTEIQLGTSQILEIFNPTNNPYDLDFPLLFIELAPGDNLLSSPGEK